MPSEEKIRNLIQAVFVYPSNLDMHTFTKLAEAITLLYDERKKLKQKIKELTMEIKSIKYSPGMKVCVIKEVGDKSMAFVDVQTPIIYKIYTGTVKFTEFDPETDEFLITIDGIAGKWKEDEIYSSFQKAKKALDEILEKNESEQLQE